MTALRSFLACFTLLSSLAPVRAAEPFLKPNDVIALVGGEDMVAAAEYGYLELLLQRALPEHRLKVRSLAWEGDTVFEQPRDLNYPTLEAQLDEIGATVVIMQFGQMESLAGTSKLPEFIKAYEKLIERVSAGGKRRVVIDLGPDAHESRGSVSEVTEQLNRFDTSWSAYRDAITRLATSAPQDFSMSIDDMVLNRDGIHRSDAGAYLQASKLATRLTGPLKNDPGFSFFLKTEDRTALAAIRAKNRLWFHYYRPQNWAFLAGDRTEQPSSRDHKDPSKRWFPEEMKQWLPLIDAKEKEIWDLAAKAAKP